MSKLIVLLFLICGDVVKSQNNTDTGQNSAFCKSPETDVNFDSLWLDTNTPPSGFHLLKGNPTARLHFAQLLKGRNLTSNEDFSKMCATSVFSNSKTQLGGHFRGYENLSATRNCTISSGDISCEFNSVTNPDFSESAKVHIPYFGEKSYLNYHIVVYCFSNGDVGWILAAIRKSISVEENSLALKELKLHGFDMNDGVPMYTTDACDVNESKSIWFPSGLWHKDRQSYFAPPSSQHGSHGWHGWNRW